jgi:2-polyprenyl-3-methyl-5-hydroxy-6-metoxy-1,4-benzoquinol methylase
MKCRHCEHELHYQFLDLGFAPPSNAYLSQADLQKPEIYFPLKLYVCEKCWLVQTEDYAQAKQLFSADYAYFSSVSSSWLAHAANYTQMIIKRLSLDNQSHVIELAANDGYLLKNFVQANIPCLGIEPTASTAAAARTQGISVLEEFFGKNLAQRLVSEGKQADLVIGNNVYAHVPDINDFTTGIKTVLKPNGTVTLEFPHLLQLIKHVQFDTVYHEHYSYLSLSCVTRIFSSQGLRVFDVEELTTHGGSLRVYGCHAENERETTVQVTKLLEQEKREGLQALETYQRFQEQANQVKNGLLAFLLEQKRNHKTVIGYGAAAKGNTLLNYAGIKPDLLPLICDAAPSKQNKFMPGSHISIVSPEKLQELKPDWVLILPWNIADEVIKQYQAVYDWGGKFVMVVPNVVIQ